MEADRGAQLWTGCEYSKRRNQADGYGSAELREVTMLTQEYLCSIKRIFLLVFLGKSKSVQKMISFRW